MNSRAATLDDHRRPTHIAIAELTLFGARYLAGYLRSCSATGAPLFPNPNVFGRRIGHGFNRTSRVLVGVLEAVIIGDQNGLSLESQRQDIQIHVLEAGQVTRRLCAVLCSLESRYGDSTPLKVSRLNQKGTSGAQAFKFLNL